MIVETQEQFSSSEVVKMIDGLSYRMFDYWCRNGVFVPVDGDRTPGSGTPRLVDRREVEIAAVCVALAQLGCRTATLKRVAAQLRATPSNFASDMLYVRTDGAITPWPTTGWAIDAMDVELSLR